MTTKVPAILQKPGPISKTDKAKLKTAMVELGKKPSRSTTRPSPSGKPSGGGKRSGK